MSIKNKNTMNPRILILEGLWDDTANAVEAAGGIPHEEPPWDWEACEKEILSGKYHGMILTGGSDIDPSLYTDDKCHEEVYGIDKLRDLVEWRVLELATVTGIPVLGICRGSQIMTAFKGGCLTQHIEHHRGSRHKVYAMPDARCFKRACNSREMQVISLHHQCVKDPGKGMRIAASAPDGTPEAVESKDGKWLGVQFHPELNAFQNGNSFAIFQWLVREAAKFAGGRAPFTPFRVAKKIYGKPQYDFDYALADSSACSTPRSKASSKAVVPFVATNPSTARQSRKAGDRAVPSMREMTQLIERSFERADVIDGSADELSVCSACGLLFDSDDDRMAHEYYVCRTGGGSPFYAAEPPTGHPAWEKRIH